MNAKTSYGGPAIGSVAINYLCRDRCVGREGE
jgi:hypothetical protein